MNRPKVWLTNNKGYDMHSAQAFGDVHILFPQPVKDVFNTSKQAYHIRQQMKDAASGDYLLVVGNMILVLLTFGIMLRRFGFVNVLLYDVRTAQYVPRVIPTHHLDMGEV